MACFICQKQAGQTVQPPGDYIYQDEHWLVCHAPADKGPLGTLFIESRRHVLDFSDFNEEEANRFGVLAGKVYTVLKSLTGAERIYQVSMMEGIPHFHTWLIPRRKEDEERGVTFLQKDLTCERAEAEELAAALRKAMEALPRKVLRTDMAA
jgi:diadenosine tetraphosphate (Ap4A) HIT family hydrolase